MSSITDDYVKKTLATARLYTVVILHKTPKRDEPGADAIVREHGIRNLELRRDGKLRIVCPIDSADIRGVSIFSTSIEDTRKIMEGDPAVIAGVFTFEVHQTRSFPGDSLSN